jgi:hypothetical protein
MMHDSPVLSTKEDRFKRSEFSLRIANLIRNRNDKNCIAFGINGAWGEGKTTVLNFISEDLKKDYPNIIVIKFNPWRFSEESKLLESFFTTVSKDLAKSLSAEEAKQGMSNHKVKEDLKKIGDILADYGDAISEIPLPVTNWLGKMVSVTFKKFSATELENKKNTLSELISKYKRKIVIIIDDIDRLSKDEVYSIFRLVKLTGDFNHFIYLLAYDEDMVSAAIGERFGDGDKLAGKNFLEKIVQIPVKLPEISLVDLSLFFANSLEEILSENKLVINENEKKRFEGIFTSTLLFNLDTPRKIVRYCNALRFSMPMLAGEINFVDLILFEGIKIFYYAHYELIRDNAELFAFDPSDERSSQFKKTFEDKYNKITDSLSDRDQRSIKAILIELFPTLRKFWDNSSFPPKKVQEWTLDRRIVSKLYFARYLTYSLSKNDVSDRAFEVLVDELKNGEPNDSVSLLLEFTKQYDIGSVVQKLRLIENKFTIEESIRIANTIALIGNHIPNYEGFMAHMVSPFSQAAIFVAQLIKNIQKKETQHDLAQDLIFSAHPFEFAFEINRWVRATNEKEKLFTEEQVLAMGEKIKDRCIQMSSPEFFFVKYPEQSAYIFMIWSKLNRTNLEEYLKSIFRTDVSVAIKLLSAITGNSYSLPSNNVYKSDFREETYDFISEYISTDWLFKLFEKEFGKDYAHDVKLDTNFTGEQSPENTVKQFMYWYLTKPKMQAES